MDAFKHLEEELKSSLQNEDVSIIGTGYDIINESDFVSLEELLALDIIDDEVYEIELNVDSLKQVYLAMTNLFSLHYDTDITLPDGIRIIFNNCNEIDEASLEEQGYYKYFTVDNKTIYTFNDEYESIIVDFADDMYIKTIRPTSTISNARKTSTAESFLDWTGRIKDALLNVQGAYKDLQDKIGNIVLNLEYDLENYSELAKEYGKTYKRYNTQLANLEIKKYSGELDPWQINDLNKKIESCKASKAKWEKLYKAAEKSRKLTEKVLPVVKKLLPTLNKICPIIKYSDMAMKGINVIMDYSAIYNSVPNPCAEDQAKADRYKNDAVYAGGVAFGFIASKMTAEALTDMGIVGQAAGSVATGGVTLMTAFVTAVTKMAISIALDTAFDVLNNNKKNSLRKNIATLKCIKNKDNDDDNKPKKKRRWWWPWRIPNNDPSGYVYEAVPTNRIEGVKATVFFDEDENVPAQWNAEEFGQINPQITEEDGLYAWDVPQGLWKVVFEKASYETTQTDWLPVPPPQLEVNIPMSQAVAPFVEEAIGAESGITLTFSKYMKPNTLTKSSRVSVTRNGKSVGGDVELLNLEKNPFNHEEYASKVKFVPNTAFTTSDEVIITVKKEVESYANKQMETDFVQCVKIESEITEIACDSMIAVDYQGTGVLEFSVLPAAAAKGRTVQVASSSSMIAATDAQCVTLNDEGKARISVSGELPGNASLHLSMPEADKEKYVVVNVVTKEAEVVKMPKASKLSGSSFEDSYLLTLTCTTKGATIYYTLDGSCPCDEQTRKKYTGPIALPEGQVTLQAIAVREGMADSDIATFNYTVTKDASGIKVVEESRDFDCNYQEGSIIVTGAKSASCHIYDLQGRELACRSNLGNQSRINVPKTDVYIVSVLFNNEQTVVHKIMAK